MRRSALLALALVLACGNALAESTTNASVAAAPSANPATTSDFSESADETPWAFSLSAYTYIVPDDRDYVQPTFKADHDWLHLEARYNYEDRDTASVWLGYNMSFGSDVTLDLTAMVGGVFGDTKGVAPGYELTLAWKKLQLYSETEYLIDCNDSSDSYLYTWTELTWAFTDRFRAGLVFERTRTLDTDFDIQHGFIAAVTYKHLDFTFTLLNPEDDPIVVLGVAYAF